MKVDVHIENIDMPVNITKDHIKRILVCALVEYQERRSFKLERVEERVNCKFAGKILNGNITINMEDN